MEENKEKKPKKIAIIFIIILIILLGFIGYFIYYMTYTDNNGEDNIDDDDKLIYKLDVYKSNSGLCLTQSDTCNEVSFSIPTETEKTKVIAFDEDYLFVLYEDNNQLKIYDKKLNESQGILLENNYKDYVIYSNDTKDNIIGIVYKTNDDKLGYFNLETGNKLYEGKYKGNYISLYQINNKYLNLSIDDKEAHILNASVEKEELTYKGEGPSFSFVSYGDSNKYLFALYSCAGDCSAIKLYNNDFKEIYTKAINIEKIGYKDNIVYFVENNKVNKVDMNGNITEYKSYNNIKGLIDDYVVYVDSNKLKIENMTSNEIKEVSEFKDSYFYDFYTSGYYTREKLDNMGEKDKVEGLYIVVDYQAKDSNGNYGMEYCYTSDKQLKTYPITEEIGGRAKPVLYLYPKEKTNVKVEFSHPEYLTTTYPKYLNNWEVTAYPNGDLYDKDNKYYYALYWDEVRYNEVDFHEGFYVEKENAINFLEEKLSIIGLNDKEKNEFIMYWLPILEQNEKNLVYFELTEERELDNKLIITPKPDSLLRVSIHIKKVNQKVNIKEQKLNKFERYGFSAVEWGGMVY